MTKENQIDVRNGWIQRFDQIQNKNHKINEKQFF
jgi:hypothetical protein